MIITFSNKGNKTPERSEKVELASLHIHLVRCDGHLDGRRTLRLQLLDLCSQLRVFSIGKAPIQGLFLWHITNAGEFIIVNVKLKHADESIF